MDKLILKIISNALKEDVKNGDITTKTTISKSQKAAGKFLVKAEGIIAGLEIAKAVFKTVDPKIKFEIKIKDGSKVKYGDVAAVVSGKAQSLLTAERTALNFLQRMSGIATSANNYSEMVKHTKAKVIDTRKTVPGLRTLDKLAVKLGGCENHRIGLYDMFLIKDNHIEVAGSITKAVEACVKYNKKHLTKFKIEVETKNLKEVEEAIKTKADIIMLDNFEIDEMKKAVKIINGTNKIEVAGSITKAVETCVKYNKKHRTKFKIEVETKNLKEVEEAIKTKADIIMLDNFEIDEMKKAVKIINGTNKIEASGGVNLETVKSIAETGVDFISVGALTHSVKALDISLEITL